MAIMQMVRRVEPTARARPQLVYKEAFLDEVRQLHPASVIDVGCGTGGLLRRLSEHGVKRLVGVEPEASAAECAREAGFEIVDAQAESLPFQNSSFDVVTLEYVTHHVSNLQRALSEALRVARQAVVILDGWYDPAIESQRVALDWDLWIKRLDRRRGFVHNPCPTPAELACALMAIGAKSISYTCKLSLTSLPVGETEETGRRLLADLSLETSLRDRAEFERIIDDARRFGISDDGCVIMGASCTE